MAASNVHFLLLSYRIFVLFGSANNTVNKLDFSASFAAWG